MQKALQAQTFKYKLNLKCEAKKNDFQKKVIIFCPTFKCLIGNAKRTHQAEELYWDTI